MLHLHTSRKCEKNKPCCVFCMNHILLRQFNALCSVYLNSFLLHRSI